MSTTRTELIASLDNVGRGDATPAEAASAIRAAIQAHEGFGERVYAALRDVTWRTLTSHAFNEELSGWFDVMRHASMLAKRASDASLAAKLRALSDLIAQSARFAELQPLDEVLNRKHVTDILRMLAAATGPTARADLARSTGLANANLSRVLAILASSGLVERKSSGKEALFSLTAAGHAALDRNGVLPARAAPDLDAWWREAPVAVGFWDANGRPVACTADLAALVQPLESPPDLRGWRAAVSAIIRDEVALEAEGARELRLGDAKWVHYCEWPYRDGGCVIIAHDITPYKLGERRLEKEIEDLRGTVAQLRREITDAERRLLAHRASIGEIRGELVDAAANEHLRINALLRNPSPEEFSSQLRDMGNRFHAFQIAVRDFVDVPIGTGGLDNNQTEVVDPRRLITEAVQAVNYLGEPDIHVQFGRLRNWVRTSTAFRTVLGQMLMISPKMFHAPNVAYTLRADVEEACLVVSLGVTEGSANQWSIAHAGGYASSSPHTVTATGLSVCQAVVEEFGGMLIVDAARNKDLIKLSFPFEPVGKKGRRRFVSRKR